VAVGSQGSPYNLSSSPKAQTAVLKTISVPNAGPRDGSYVSPPVYIIAPNP